MREDDDDDDHFSLSESEIMLMGFFVIARERGKLDELRAVMERAISGVVPVWNPGRSVEEVAAECSERVEDEMTTEEREALWNELRVALRTPEEQRRADRKRRGKSV